MIGPVIRFLDVGHSHRQIEPELRSAYERVMASGHYILGSEVEAFEDQLASFEQVDHAVGVGSGLDALVLTLAACGIGPGDEVIVPAHTFVATWMAVSRVGATPVPVEPLPDTLNVDPDAVEAAVTPRTVAIMPVHLYGQPADVLSLRRIAAARGLLLLADGAQAIGSCVRGESTSAMADASTLSFYPAKNLGAIGDGGAVLTDDGGLADRVRRLRNYGARDKYTYPHLGYNSRLDELQAALLAVKLGRLREWTDRRAAIATTYTRAFAGTGLRLTAQAPGMESNWHLYVVRTRRRHEFVDHVAREGVETGIHYPTPPHRQPAYAQYASAALPVAEQAAEEVVSLPMGPHLHDAEVQRIVDVVGSWRE